jgi:zinc finger BED domain-containing protein 5/7/8/9
LELWLSKVERNDFDSFEELNEFRTNEFSGCGDIKELVSFHLRSLVSQFEGYLPDTGLAADATWIVNPFAVDVRRMPETLSAKEQGHLIEISCDEALKTVLNKDGCIGLWRAAEKEFPSVAGKALRRLVMFATSYYCESGFSVMVAIKTKYRNRLNSTSLESQLRVRLSQFEPRIKMLCDKVQSHPSH